MEACRSEERRLNGRIGGKGKKGWLEGGLICKWNGGGTRLNFTSNGTGNFLLGDEGGRRRGFTSNQALRRVT